MGLWMFHTISAVVADDFKNATIYIKNGTGSVDLSCGEVPEKATAIDWFIKKSNTWIRILKFKHMKPNTAPQYYTNNSKDKYDISTSVNTSLVVKNIVPMDIGVYKCSTRGGTQDYSYITLLKIEGESVFVLVFQLQLPTFNFNSFTLNYFK